MRRATNEDQFLIAELNKSMRVLQTSLGLDHQTRMFGNSQGKLMVVADGMGGHEAGERASQLAVDSVVTYVLNTMQWFFRFDAENDQEVREELCASLLHCQKMLVDEVESLPQRGGMGTTLTMAYLLWPRLYLVHVGDSRCYLLRGGELRQITRDHTLAQLSKEASGETDADEDEDPRASGSNSLWNVINASDDHLSPEIYTAELQLGDALLLCTDGLYKHVRRQRLAEVLQSGQSSQQICQTLIDEANGDGGSDNITVVVARFCADTENGCEDAAHASDELELDLALADTGDYIHPGIRTHHDGKKPVAQTNDC
ncbi:MAG TPA: protein phosphatase 2C domain-containing protein [Pirellulaceae bacterium]|nr:protein phosphatase 2C domain-containing protein [Pirellulaceae bacterium]